MNMTPSRHYQTFYKILKKYKISIHWVTKVKMIEILEEPDTFECPFADTAINYSKRRIYAQAAKMKRDLTLLPVLIHEAGHIVVGGGNDDEPSFFYWEYLVAKACDILPQWIANNDAYQFSTEDISKMKGEAFYTEEVATFCEDPHGLDYPNYGGLPDFMQDAVLAFTKILGENLGILQTLPKGIYEAQDPRTTIYS